MCGRAACTLENSALCKACDYKDAGGKRRPTLWENDETGNGRTYSPSYNLAPTDVVPCIVSGRHFKSDDKQVLHPMIWGMIPRWHKEDQKMHGLSTHNARFEGLSSSNLYSPPLSLGQRCVIICEGFYEWRTTGKQVNKGARQPYFIYAKQEEDFKIEDRVTWREEWSEDFGWRGIRLLKLAGIFDCRLSAQGKKIYSCTMITRQANDVLSWLHHRAPVFLETDKEVNDWLDFDNIPLNDAIKGLHDPTKNSLQWHPVDPNVNNSRFKSASCYQPIILKEKKTAASRPGLLSSWLKTGSMIPAGKRKVPDIGESDEDADSKRSKPK